MKHVDLDHLKRTNPQLDAEELDSLLTALDAMPRRKKKGYRLAPVGSDRVYTEPPWADADNSDCNCNCRR